MVKSLEFHDLFIGDISITPIFKSWHNLGTSLFGTTLSTDMGHVEVNKSVKLHSNDSSSPSLNSMGKSPLLSTMKVDFIYSSSNEGGFVEVFL